MSTRPRSYAFCGGAFGDEGKGRIVDEYVSQLAEKHPVIVFRDNGGANAGHTVVLPNGEKIALHQIPSGVFCEQATVILGKEMVLHPGDLLLELSEIKRQATDFPLGTILIDQQAILSLDTHRAFETALKQWQTGSKGSTGRGIAPAYADVLLRHPLRMRDIVDWNAEKLTEHYHLYSALLKGLNQTLASVEVPTLDGRTNRVGTIKEFFAQLKKQADKLRPYVADTMPVLRKSWSDPQYAFVFEKAQAIGLDHRWGVYPDVTASNTCFDGIYSATEGIVNPDDIEVRAAVIKATYMSSVGSRVLPTIMKNELATRIREDANEYGATTKRPRDIAYLDLVALKFYAQLGNINSYVLTHMDITYPKTPVKMCTKYTIDGKQAFYRPDQRHLDKVTPEYIELDAWDAAALDKCTSCKDLPEEAKKFIKKLEQELNIKVSVITTGPQRNQSLHFKT